MPYFMDIYYDTESCYDWGCEPYEGYATYFAFYMDYSCEFTRIAKPNIPPLIAYVGEEEVSYTLPTLKDTVSVEFGNGDGMSFCG